MCVARFVEGGNSEVGGVQIIVLRFLSQSRWWQTSAWSWVVVVVVVLLRVVVVGQVAVLLVVAVVVVVRILSAVTVAVV